MALAELLLQRPGDSLGPSWSSQDHMCGPSLPRTKPPPGMLVLWDRAHLSNTSAL